MSPRPNRGRLLLQTIAYIAPLGGDPFVANAFKFISGRIFPESDLPLVGEPIRAAEGNFEICELRNDA